MQSPEDSDGHNLPEDSEGCNLSEDSEGCNLPEDSVGCKLPEDSEGCNVPEDCERRNLPEDSEGCYLPEDSEGCNPLEDSEGCYLPEDSEGPVWPMHLSQVRSSEMFAVNAMLYVLQSLARAAIHLKCYSGKSISVTVLRYGHIPVHNFTGSKQLPKGGTYAKSLAIY